jgi:pilus assembly protein CpaC
MGHKNTHITLNQGGRLLRGVLIGWIACCSLSLSIPGLTAEQTTSGSIREIGPSEFVSVPLYKSKIIEVKTAVKKLSVGNPDIADILILRSNQVYVVGKNLGTTNVVLWDSSNRIISNIDIEITHDADTLKSKLYELLPNEQIGVHSSQGTIILSGEVSGPAQVDAALALATSFAPTDEEGNVEEGKVVNLMHVGGIQQVMLEVKVAEINRTVLRKLDIDFLAIDESTNWTIGAVNGGASFLPGVGLPGAVIDQLASHDSTVDDKGFFAKFLSDQFLFKSVINASKNNGLAKVLAEPTLTTLSGQEATFLSGGEFPIPVPQQNGNTTIEFKEFGIGMNFVPVVLDSSNINLKVAVRVDELTSTSPVVLGVNNTRQTFVIPSLKSRRASSSLELADGQTIAIAGLISDNLRENVDKFPGLGDVPVLGLLFTSEEFLKDQSELVIFVTPKLAQPIPKDKMKLPTDNFVEPGELGFYLLGQMEGKAKEEDVKSVDTNEHAGLEGSFGHQL